MINVGCHSRSSGIFLKDKERFWTGQNDRMNDRKKLNNIAGNS
jgi:hypothetical protein